MQSSKGDRSAMPLKPAVLAVLCAMAFVPNASAQTRIRLATLIPSGTSYHHSLEEMAQKWKQASNGSISVTIYADGTMGAKMKSSAACGSASCRVRC